MTDADNTLTLDTTKGKVVIHMRPTSLPATSPASRSSSREGFYDGIVFHRVIDGFMAQTGCPHGTGTGGSGKKLKAEFNREPHRRGTVSMARAQSPDSGDSQFFICFADAPFLDGQYTVWGQVTEGMGNVDKIKRGEPVVDPDRIISAKMARTHNRVRPHRDGVVSPLEVNRSGAGIARARRQKLKGRPCVAGVARRRTPRPPWQTIHARSDKSGSGPVRKRPAWPRNSCDP